METPGWIRLYARSHLRQAERELSLLSTNSNNEVPMDVLVDGMEHIAEQARRKYDWGITMSLEEERLCSNIHSTFANLAIEMKKWDRSNCRYQM